MSFDYLETAEEADELLREYGAQWTIRNKAGSGYTPDSGMNPGTSTDMTPFAALFDYKEKDYGIKRADGTQILVGDKKLLVSAIGITASLAPGDLALAPSTSVKWQVVNVKEVAPAGVTVLWELQVRK